MLKEKIEKSQTDSADCKDMRKQQICIKRGVLVARLNEHPTDCAGQMLSRK